MTYCLLIGEYNMQINKTFTPRWQDSVTCVFSNCYYKLESSLYALGLYSKLLIPNIKCFN